MCTACRDESEPEMIEDTDAEKPEGWLDDEPELVADESAEKPEDWSVPLYTVCSVLYFCKYAAGFCTLKLMFPLNTSSNLQ